LVDSSLDEYELTDLETKYHLGLETKLIGIDDDVDKVIKDVENVED
jgi:hypothetical protein